MISPPSTLRPKLLLQPHKLLCLDLQNFLKKTNKQTSQQTTAGLCLKIEWKILPRSLPEMHSETAFPVSRELCYWRWLGSMRSDLATADPHSQNTDSGKGQFLMDRMVPAAPEVTGDDTWLVWKGIETGGLQVRSTVGHKLHRVCSEHGIYRTWKKKNLYFLWSKICIEMPVLRKISYISFLV